MDEFLLPLRIEALEEGGYLSTAEDLPGLVAQGRTVSETMEIAQDIARKMIESYEQYGDPLPPKGAAALRRRPRTTTVKVPVGLSWEPIQA